MLESTPTFGIYNFNIKTGAAQKIPLSQMQTRYPCNVTALKRMNIFLIPFKSSIHRFFLDNSVSSSFFIGLGYHANPREIRGGGSGNTMIDFIIILYRNTTLQLDKKTKMHQDIDAVQRN